MDPLSILISPSIKAGTVPFHHEYSLIIRVEDAPTHLGSVSNIHPD